MNLFRSEDHVKRRPQYVSLADDYILPVADWGKVFSIPVFRDRLEQSLSQAETYLEDNHRALKEIGKTSPYWQLPFISDLSVVNLSRYRVVGHYTRYEEEVLNSLKDAKQNILSGIENPSKRRENHLIWAAPGSGKTFLVQQIVKSQGELIQYHELNLAKLDEKGFSSALEVLSKTSEPTLCLVDEVDAKQNEPWPYEILLPFLDKAIEKSTSIVFVFAGSSGFSLAGMKQRLGSRPKGTDLLSRIPTENEFIIPPMSFGDRILIVLSQFVAAGRETGREINAVEKLGLYYIAQNSKLANARQLREFAVRVEERIPPGEDRIKYDNLFMPGDPENKRFWLEVSSASEELLNKFVTIES
ncbi:MAG: AAA family ATPase [Chloroflexi bacterium]|nr:AAA family ATPase [Chloroflexota bacterium]